jgi:hypothetical protein
VPPPSTPRMRSPGFTILLCLAPFASVGKEQTRRILISGGAHDSRSELPSFRGFVS